MLRLTFNKKARLVAIAGIRKFETASFTGAVLGAFGSNPRITAVAALAIFILCPVSEVVIADVGMYTRHQRRA